MEPIRPVLLQAVLIPSDFTIPSFYGFTDLQRTYRAIDAVYPCDV